uniref:Uncharacterized protein n=1 Tax=Oryctolagus cuniculus TaxID=9986 RepID=A0A5F9CXH5_RABIT
MTWSLPDGSLISGFHSEDSFWEKLARGTQDTRQFIPHIALQGTWTASPGRWCCWQCRCILQRLCTGCSSGSGTTRGRGCAPPCAHPESARREGRASQAAAGEGTRRLGHRCSVPSLPSSLLSWPPSNSYVSSNGRGFGEHYENLSGTKTEDRMQLSQMACTMCQN